MAWPNPDPSTPSRPPVPPPPAFAPPPASYPPPPAQHPWPASQPPIFLQSRNRGNFGRGPGRKGANAALSVAVAVLVVMTVGGLLLREAGRSNPGGYQLPSGENAIATDGRSNIPDDKVSVSYRPLAREFESVAPDYGSGPDDGYEWKLNRWSDRGRSYIKLTSVAFQPPLNSAARTRRFVAYKASENDANAHAALRYQTRTIAGRRAYVWRYRDADGDFQLSAWLPGARDSFRYSCQVLSDDPLAGTLHRQCLSVFETLRIRR